MNAVDVGDQGDDLGRGDARAVACFSHQAARLTPEFGLDLVGFGAGAVGGGLGLRRSLRRGVGFRFGGFHRRHDLLCRGVRFNRRLRRLRLGYRRRIRFCGRDGRRPRAARCQEQHHHQKNCL